MVIRYSFRSTKLIWNHFHKAFDSTSYVRIVSERDVLISMLADPALASMFHLEGCIGLHACFHSFSLHLNFAYMKNTLDDLSLFMLLMALFLPQGCLTVMLQLVHIPHPMYGTTQCYMYTATVVHVIDYVDSLEINLSDLILSKELGVRCGE